MPRELIIAQKKPKSLSDDEIQAINVFVVSILPYIESESTQFKTNQVFDSYRHKFMIGRNINMFYPNQSQYYIFNRN